MDVFDEVFESLSPSERRAEHLRRGPVIDDARDAVAAQVRGGDAGRLGRLVTKMRGEAAREQINADRCSQRDREDEASVHYARAATFLACAQMVEHAMRAAHDNERAQTAEDFR